MQNLNYAELQLEIPSRKKGLGRPVVKTKKDRDKTVKKGLNCEERSETGGEFMGGEIGEVADLRAN